MIKLTIHASFFLLLTARSAVQPHMLWNLKYINVGNVAYQAHCKNAYHSLENSATDNISFSSQWLQTVKALYHKQQAVRPFFMATERSHHALVQTLMSTSTSTISTALGALYYYMFIYHTSVHKMAFRICTKVISSNRVFQVSSCVAWNCKHMDTLFQISPDPFLNMVHMNGSMHLFTARLRLKVNFFYSTRTFCSFITFLNKCLILH